MTVADEIAKWLADKEITHAFGIIGAGNIALWNAIEALGKTQIVCVHHEQTAAMCAAAYFRIAGKMGVVLVTTGAGSTNAITGVVSAWMDSTPLLVIAGNEESKYLDAPTRVLGVQGYRSADAARPFTKYAARASVFDWRTILDGCYDEAIEPRQGPCWCELPKDVQNAAV